MFFVFKLPELSRSCSKQIINIFQLSINYIFQLYSEPVARRCSVKRVSLKNSQNAQENTSYFNKFAGLRPATLLKKSLWQRCFPLNFVKFLRTPFFTEYLWLLLLYISFSYNESKFLLSCHIENRAVRYYVILIGNFVVRIKVARVVNIGFYELIFFIIW